MKNLNTRIYAVKRFYAEYSRLIWLILFSFLLIFIALLSHLARDAQVQETAEDSGELPTPVQVVIVGDDTVYTSAIAKVQNDNQVTISSLANGVANNVRVELGEEVDEGEKLVDITDTYSGENFYDEQVAIARKQAETAETNQKALDDSYDDQVRQLEIQSEDPAEQKALLESNIQTINDQISHADESIEKAKATIADIQDLIEEYKDFEEDEIEDVNDDFTREQLTLQNQSTILNYEQSIDSYEQQINQLQDTISQLEDRRELLQYQTSSEYTPAELADINKQIGMQQLKTQRDLAKIQKETAELNVRLIEAQQELKTVESPISGTVQELLIKEGEVVTVGKPLMVINGDLEMVLVAYVTSEVIAQVDDSEDVLVFVNNAEYSANIEFIAEKPDTNGFFEIRVDPSGDLEERLNVGTTIEINLPVKKEAEENEEEETNEFVYVPIDTVFKTNTSEYVLIAVGERAVRQEVSTGEIVGEQIQILAGLQEGDLVINDRRVIENEYIEVINLEETEEEE